MTKKTKKRNIKPPSRKQRTREHAKRRAWERLGVEFASKDINAITAMIQNGQSTFISDRSVHCTCHEVVYNGMTFTVLYDKYRRIISTIYKG